MNSEQKLLCFLVGYTVLASTILASFSLRGSDSHVLVGLFLGSTFAYAILASSWTVLGPGTKKLRLPLAAVLLMVFPIVFLFSGDGDVFFLVVLSQFLIAAMVQLLVWILWLGFGVRLFKTEVATGSPGVNERIHQYGIRHLMIVTTAVALLLTAGRILVPFARRYSTGGDLPIFVFLAFSACIVCVPVFFSVLSLKRCVLPTILVVGLSVLATLSELSLFISLRLRGPDFLHFVWINFFTMLPVMGVAIGLRLADYRLVKS